MITSGENWVDDLLNSYLQQRSFNFFELFISYHSKNWTLTPILMKGRQFWHLNAPGKPEITGSLFYPMALSKWYVLKYTSVTSEIWKKVYSLSYMDGWLILVVWLEFNDRISQLTTSISNNCNDQWLDSLNWRFHVRSRAPTKGQSIMLDMIFYDTNMYRFDNILKEMFNLTSHCFLFIFTCT